MSVGAGASDREILRWMANPSQDHVKGSIWIEFMNLKVVHVPTLEFPVPTSNSHPIILTFRDSPSWIPERQSYII